MYFETFLQLNCGEYETEFSSDIFLNTLNSWRLFIFKFIFFFHFLWAAEDLITSSSIRVEDWTFLAV